MKKLILLVIVVLCAVCIPAGCSRRINYLDYVSERRTDIFIYKDDTTEITVYCSEREQPYAADGYKGEMCPVTEIFASLPKNPQELSVSVEGHEGEMNYQSVDNRYYLSFTATAFEKSALEVTLTADGKTTTYTLQSVKSEGVFGCDKAVLCAVDYDRELFDGLTSNGLFDGEIYVRLLYDDGCYYYVGVCDKERNITAYLLDGERGKVIATKTLQG